MREILFRGKIIEPCHYCGQWLEGFYGVDDGKTFIAIQQKNGLNGFFCDPLTVGQYTGLKDLHGTRVFEGDIIRYCERLDYQMYQDSIEDPEAYDGELYNPAFSIGAVVYYTDSFSGFDINNHKFDCNGLSELMCSGDYYYEVIGNIHDNPELMGGNTHG